LTSAPAGATSYVVAADADQAQHLLASVRSFILHQPLLRTRMKVEARRVVFLADRERVSSLEVVPSDEASSYGARPWLLIADELAVWPETPNSRGVWAAMVSALPKVEGSRLVVLTSAGSPSHWAMGVLEQARRSPSWRVSETPGPLPWIDPEVLVVQRSLLTPSQYARLHENKWVAGEDRLTSPEQVRRCIGHRGTLPPRKGVRYYCGLDVGLVNDRTVLTVAHRERREGGDVVVVDRQTAWQGTRANPVDLSEVEAACYEASKTYGGGKLIFDPWQSVHLAQRLRARRVKTEAFTFSSASVGRLALTLYRLLRDGALDLPDDDELAAELSSVILKENQPGQYRIDTQGSGHDDRVISLALVAQKLAAEPHRGSHMFIAQGEVPKVRLLRRESSPNNEPPVPVVEPGQKRRIPPGQSIRIGKFVVDRRYYHPPGSPGSR
jgi:phage terminase large subunit-like protein